jgi:hypothetical protein
VVTKAELWKKCRLSMMLSPKGRCYSLRISQTLFFPVT